MTIEEMETKIRSLFPHVSLEKQEGPGDSSFLVAPENLRALCLHLRDEEELRFDYLTCLSGVDEGETLATVYHIHSLALGHFLTLRTRVPRENPEIDTVSDIWPAANWFEREAWDLFGIVYLGHPDPRRIMLPDDWEGHPLRKDFVDPHRYQEIDNERDYGI